MASTRSGKGLGNRVVNKDECGELVDKTIVIKRVSKVVKGGRRFSFSALVVSGDGMGHVGFGLGKAGEVPEALRKASEQARKNLYKVPIKGTSIPHDLSSEYGPCKVILKPGKPGTGVIAGAVVRAVVESAGIKDIRTKCIGSSNAHNVLYATFKGLTSLLGPEQTAHLRGLNLEECGYQQY